MATVDGRLGHDICFFCHSKAGYSHNPLCHVGLLEENAALKRENEAQSEVLRKVLEGLLGFRACMEAQRTDGPLPVGHDDPDESCGDGICFRSGATIDEDIAVIKAALSRPTSDKAGK